MKIKKKEDGTNIMLCPNCGFDKTHFESSINYDSGKIEKRPSIELNFSCEECGLFALDFKQHKGETEIYVKENDKT